MLRFSHYFQMDTGDIIGYTLEKATGILWGRDSMEAVVPPSHGDLNYVYRIWDGKEHSIYTEQAGSEARMPKNIKPSRDRNRLESEIPMLEDQYTPGMVPYVYFLGTVTCACDMEDRSDYAVIHDAMLEHETLPGLAEGISAFMVNTLLLNSDVVMDHKEKKGLVKKFISPNLCDIAGKLVFTEPCMDLYDRNGVHAPNRGFMKKGLYEDETLRLEVSKLKFRFMTDTRALLHGDLRMGSTFIRQGSAKIFDCKFGACAPMGYNVGNVVTSLILAYDNGLSTDDGPFCNWYLNTIEETVDLFIERFNRECDETMTEPTARVEDFREWYFGRILKDTASCAGMGLHRKVVGMANIVDVTAIQDKAKRLLAERIDIPAGKDYIMNQGSFGTGANYAATMLRAKEVTQKMF